jgi:hypothetical protein
VAPFLLIVSGCAGAFLAAAGKPVERRDQIGMAICCSDDEGGIFFPISRSDESGF